MRNPLAFFLLLFALGGFWWMQHRPATVPATVEAPASSSRHAPAAEPLALPSPAAAPPASPTAASTATTGLPAYLPAEARQTIALIQRGGPYPHRQDDGVFGNFEGHLPRQPRGWYHEYTVETPGARNRGTRRIITGGTPPREWYYTDDHYASFRRFDVH